MGKLKKKKLKGVLFGGDFLKKRQQKKNEALEKYKNRTVNSSEHLNEEDKEIYNELVKNSTSFEKIAPFPKMDHVKPVENDIRYFFNPQEVVNHAKKCRPVLLEKVVKQILKFLQYKQIYGTNVEKELYTNMSLPEFCDRLVSKRPIYFLQSADHWLLRSGIGGAAHWESIGTEEQFTPLNLTEYMSYDEILFGALTSVSSFNHFINNGNRNNCGKMNENKDSYTNTGVYVGCVGARFEKEGFMERQFMGITDTQNIEEKGYGTRNNEWFNLWADFYGVDNFLTHESAQNLIGDRVAKHKNENHDILLDVSVYKERIRISCETFLLDANLRGQEEDRDVYVVGIGLGIGAWAMMKDKQTKIFMEIYKEVIQSHILDHIKTIRLSWLGEEHNQKWNGNETDIIFPNDVMLDRAGNEIKIEINRREPFEKVEGEPLVIAMYAWDGNSFPGNEYWKGMVTASGDPAAAACSTISQLQNPMINTRYCNGANTIVLCPKEDGSCVAVPISEYQIEEN